MFGLSYGASYGEKAATFIAPKTVLKTQSYEESHDVTELHPSVVKVEETVRSHVPRVSFTESSVDSQLAVPKITFQEKLSTQNVKVPTIQFEGETREVEKLIPKVEYTKAAAGGTQYVPVVEYEDVEVTKYELVPKVEYEDVQLTTYHHQPELAYESRSYSVPRYGVTYQPQQRAVVWEEKEFWPETY